MVAKKAVSVSNIKMKSSQNKLTSSAKRKSSNAKVLVVPGSGKILVNQKNAKDYFSAIVYDFAKLFLPLQLLSCENSYDIFVKVKGGGIMSQLDAIQLAISKTLAKIQGKNRSLLSTQNLLFSDSRIKERRKYGLRKARKAAQYHKR